MTRLFSIDDILISQSANWYTMKLGELEAERKDFSRIIPEGIDLDSVEFANLRVDDPDLWTRIHALFVEIQNLEREIIVHKARYKPGTNIGALLVAGLKTLPSGWDELLVGRRPFPGADDDFGDPATMGEEARQRYDTSLIPPK